MFDQKQIQEILAMKETLGVSIENFEKSNINPSVATLVQRKLVKLASMKQFGVVSEEDDEFELQAETLDSIPNNFLEEYE